MVRSRIRCSTQNNIYILITLRANIYYRVGVVKNVKTENLTYLKSKMHHFIFYKVRSTPNKEVYIQSFGM
jgi:hypothetical protein